MTKSLFFKRTVKRGFGDTVLSRTALSLEFHTRLGSPLKVATVAVKFHDCTGDMQGDTLAMLGLSLFQTRLRLVRGGTLARRRPLLTGRV